MDDFLTNWITQLRKGVVEFCVLKTLEDDPLYGYDIVRQLRALEVLVISEGTIYPILSRLRNDGLLKTYLEESPEGPARKYYTLTARGKEMLREMRLVWTTLTEGVDHAHGTKGKP
jgi:PadR family transcriptional regulator, regulatory protein PadR